MNKSEFIKAVSDHSGESQVAVTRVLDSMAATTKDQIKAGGTVELRGLFTVKVSAKESRLARNPKTGEQVTIPARNVVKIKASPDLNTAANQ